MHPSKWDWHKIGLFFSMLPIVVVAAWVSYWHMRGVAIKHGQAAFMAALLPFSVDGLIMAGYIKNRAVKGHMTLWERIWCPIAVYGGLAVSLVANVLSSVYTNIIDACIAGWPAIALFVGIKVMGIPMPSMVDMVKAVQTVTEAVKPTKTTAPKKVTTTPKAPTPPRKRASRAKATEAKISDSLYKAAVIDPDAAMA